MTDHRQAIDVDLLSQDEFYYEVMKRDDPRVLNCDFCHQVKQLLNNGEPSIF